MQYHSQSYGIRSSNTIRADVSRDDRRTRPSNVHRLIRATDSHVRIRTVKSDINRKDLERQDSAPITNSANATSARSFAQSFGSRRFFPRFETFELRKISETKRVRSFRENLASPFSRNFLVEFQLRVVFAERSSRETAREKRSLRLRFPWKNSLKPRPRAFPRSVFLLSFADYLLLLFRHGHLT